MEEDMEILDIKTKILIHDPSAMGIKKFQEVIILPEHMKFQEDIEELVMEERKDEAKRIALNMLRENALSCEQISKYTGLTVAEVQALS